MRYSRCPYAIYGVQHLKDSVHEGLCQLFPITSDRQKVIKVACKHVTLRCLFRSGGYWGHMKSTMAKLLDAVTTSESTVIGSFELVVLSKVDDDWWR